MNNFKNYFPIRQKPAKHNFQKGDVLVLFGELFNRGYANGLVEEALANGLTIVRATVGRRDENNQLRSLTPAESENIPKPFINIPLEAGFDLEADDTGKTPNDYLKEVKLSTWETGKVPNESLQKSRQKGRERFRKQVQNFSQELEKYLTPGRHVHFAHLMAGGVPRTKIVMPLMNRVFKGTGDRYLASKTFWESGIGQFLAMNFHEVTAETFNILIDATTSLRKKIESEKGHVSYVAYGYHGNEVYLQNEFVWKSYAPYLQGFAKIELENYSKTWSEKGVHCCVYNCPEILTNSSSIFQGLEIPLYNLLRALDVKKPNSALTQKVKTECLQALKTPDLLNKLYELVENYFASPHVQSTSDYSTWPQHSSKEQLAFTLQTSDDIIELHKDEKALMTAQLSELIFRACGYIMLHEGYNPQHPVAWIGHDAVIACVTE